MESIEKISASIPDEVPPEKNAENEIITALYDVGEKISGLIMKMTETASKKEMETDDNDDNDDNDVETEIEEKGDDE